MSWILAEIAGSCFSAVRVIEMAFRAEARVPYPDAFDARYFDDIERVTDAVELVLSTHPPDAALPIESIQDEVERALMDGGHYAVARRYILYRNARAQTL